MASQGAADVAGVGAGSTEDSQRRRVSMNMHSPAENGRERNGELGKLSE